ncbi:MAG: hypothetical protein AVDCRST_MAG22-1691 [uncultured Rubrobacteraceae bacterium]|uniref:Uncharacterized protein n=1 Tax=uncultured Rubrobacteraceae bacterium TaxID=349277 RepID=A0A6J4PE02_9ACTN|nr:MAG: hypothetical protein AVDCRST_MAG22-1691 [uncultured Rubrobacteraceae bacterium]
MGEPEGAQEPPHGGHRESHPADAAQEGRPLPRGGVGARLYVLFEQPRDGCVGLRGPATALAGSERLLVGREPAVAFDRREADAEETGGSGFGHPVLDGGDDPDA